MLTFRPLLFTALALAVPTASADAQGAVHVVDVTDPSALGWYAALALAADGDVILVRHATYAYGTYLGDKSLVIAADTGYAPVLGSGDTCEITGNEPITISNLGPDRRVVLRGLEVEGLFLGNCAGQVWVEDCVVHDQQPAMRAVGCTDVVLHDVEIKGTNQSQYDMYGTCWVGNALELTSTQAVLHDVLATGGSGLSLSWSGDLGGYQQAWGRHGIQVKGGSLWLSGSEVQGGDGGDGGVDQLLDACIPGTSAGHGLLLSSDAPQVMLRGVTATGGVPGLFVGPPDCSSGSATDGAPGLGVQVSSGAAQELPGTPVDLDVPSPVREQQLLTASVSGPAGLPVLLLAGPESGALSLASVSGPLLTGVPLLVVPLGALPAGGTLTLQAAVPELGAGVQFASWTIQVVTVEGGEYIAGPATSVLLLDGGI